MDDDWIFRPIQLVYIDFTTTVDTRHFGQSMALYSIFSGKYTPYRFYQIYAFLL